MAMIYHWFVTRNCSSGFLETIIRFHHSAILCYNPSMTERPLTPSHTGKPGQSDAWCCGLPLVETLPLTPEERFYISRAEEDASRLAFLAFWAPFVGVIVGFLLVKLTDAIGNSDLASVMMGVYFLVMVILVAMAFLVPRERRAQAAALRQDLAGGVKLRFAGVIRELPDAEEPEYMLFKRGLLQKHSTSMQSLEVLPISGQVLVANGICPRGWVKVKLVYTAPQAEFTADTYQQLSAMDIDEVPSMRAGNRSLTDDEITEIRQYIATTLRKPLPILLFTNLILLPGFILALLDHTLFHDWKTLIHIPTFIFTIWSDIWYIRHFLFTRQLARDAESGVVNVLACEVTDDELAEMPDQPTSGLTSLEVLPITRHIWAEDGRPAEWRKHMKS